MTALQGIRVIEFAQGIAGPLAAARLGQLGADVIKVERGDGDWLRHAMPRIPELGVSAAFFELNTGKRSVRLDADAGEAGRFLRALLESADVFITDQPREALLALGLDASLYGIYAPNPRLVAATISPWGETGPWRKRKGSELAVQAVAGYTRYLGVQGRPACRLGPDVAGTGTGIFTSQAILAALYARQQNGQGQHIGLSALNTLLALKSVHLAAQTNPEQYAGARVGGAHYPPERGWRTGCGNLFFAFGGSVGKGRPGWVNFIEEAGFTRLLDDPRFDKTGRNSAGYGVDAPTLKPEYEREFARYSADELVAMVRKHGGNAASYQRVDQALSHPQTQALGLLRTIPAGKDDSSTTVTVRRFPARFSRLPTDMQDAASSPGMGIRPTPPGT